MGACCQWLCFAEEVNFLLLQEVNFSTLLLTACVILLKYSEREDSDFWILNQTMTSLEHFLSNNLRMVTNGEANAPGSLLPHTSCGLWSAN